MGKISVKILNTHWPGRIIKIVSVGKTRKKPSRDRQELEKMRMKMYLLIIYSLAKIE